MDEQDVNKDILVGTKFSEIDKDRTNIDSLAEIEVPTGKWPRRYVQYVECMMSMYSVTNNNHA